MFDSGACLVHLKLKRHKRGRSPHGSKYRTRRISWTHVIQIAPQGSLCTHHQPGVHPHVLQRRPNCKSSITGAGQECKPLLSSRRPKLRSRQVEAKENMGANPGCPNLSRWNGEHKFNSSCCHGCLRHAGLYIPPASVCNTACTCDRKRPVCSSFKYTHIYIYI